MADRSIAAHNLSQYYCGKCLYLLFELLLQSFKWLKNVIVDIPWQSLTQQALMRHNKDKSNTDSTSETMFTALLVMEGSIICLACDVMNALVHAYTVEQWPSQTINAGHYANVTGSIEAELHVVCSTCTGHI